MNADMVLDAPVDELPPEARLDFLDIAAGRNAVNHALFFRQTFESEDHVVKHGFDTTRPLVERHARLACICAKAHQHGNEATEILKATLEIEQDFFGRLRDEFPPLPFAEGAEKIFG